MLSIFHFYRLISFCLIDLLCLVSIDKQQIYAHPSFFPQHNQIRLLNPPKKDQIVEFFSFYCFHCFILNCKLHWSEKLQAKHPHLEIISYHLNEPGRLSNTLTKIWAVALFLGITEKVKRPLFLKIQTQRRKVTEEMLWKILETKGGVSSETLKSLKESFFIQNCIQEQEEKAREWEIDGTPVCVVNGSFKAYLSLFIRREENQEVYFDSERFPQILDLKDPADFDS